MEIDEIYEGIIAGDMNAVVEEVTAAIEDGRTAAAILNESMVPAMTEIGKRFETGDCFVPEMLIASRAMKAGLAVLRPHLQAADVKPAGTMIIGTVQGDIHDIGKNLVAMMVEGVGWQVVDLGVNVTPQQFVAAVQEHKPRVVGMSALLTTTQNTMRATMQALKDAGLRDQVTVMIGGAPVTERFANDIGADLYALDASSAATQLLALANA
ncbi:cobalamin-binding protein [bacterium]|jgi:5-methyltetrahydrofolate--homocysteine methyltransferase|nr:cobalamin-binding protein [bacterium]